MTAYTEQQHADDALAILDATNTERAVIVCLSRGAQRAMLLAGHHRSDGDEERWLEALGRLYEKISEWNQPRASTPEVSA
jgi:pimeloyl-ACP methyl ester carboxylesterase